VTWPVSSGDIKTTDVAEIALEKVELPLKVNAKVETLWAAHNEQRLRWDKEYK